MRGGEREEIRRERRRRDESMRSGQGISRRVTLRERMGKRW